MGHVGHAETVRSRALSVLTSAFFLGQFLSPLVVGPVSNVVGLGAMFLGIGVGLAGGAVAFALATGYDTHPAESDPKPAERSPNEHPTNQLD